MKKRTSKRKNRLRRRFSKRVGGKRVFVKKRKQLRKRLKPSQLLRQKAIVLNTAESDYLRQKRIIEQSREKLLITTKGRKKKIPSKAVVKWYSGRKRIAKRYRGKRNIYGLRIHIRFVGIQYLTNKRGKYIKHVRFLNRRNHWSPKSDKWVRANWMLIHERMQRLYKDRIAAYDFNVTYLYKDTVNKLKIKR